MGISKPRPDYDPELPVYTVCPGCNALLGGVVQPDCPICLGHGAITLGRRALYYDEPETVALAITYTLDSVLSQLHEATSFSDEQTADARARVERLLDLGIMEPSAALPPYERDGADLGYLDTGGAREHSQYLWAREWQEVFEGPGDPWAASEYWDGVDQIDAHYGCPPEVGRSTYEARRGNSELRRTTEATVDANIDRANTRQTDPASRVGPAPTED